MQRAHLDWPFFDAPHRALAANLGAWSAAHLHHVDDADRDANDARCRSLVATLGDAGWARYAVPAAHGGALEQLDSRALCIVRETLAYHDGLADFAFAMQGLGSGAITLAGSEDVRRRYLPRVASGRAIAAFALSEPDAGSDVAAMSTRAVADGDAFVLDGCKTWISNGGIADFYTVFARTSERPGARGISAFVVDADTPGLSVTDRIDVIAPHPLATLRFERCRVPAGHLLGPIDEGFKIAMRTLDIFRASVAAAALGFARRAFDEALAHAQRRRMFGHTLADFQLTQTTLADMATDIDAAALLTYRAAWQRDVPKINATREAAMAKLTATENAQRVIDRAVQLFGGAGVAKGNIVESLYREIRALRIYEGASEVQRLIIGRESLKGVPSGAKTAEGRDVTDQPTYTAHLDTFAADHLPPRSQWPDFRFDLPELQYPERINCGEALLDAQVERGRGPARAVGAMVDGRPVFATYDQLLAQANRIANVLVNELDLVPGNRVLLRAPNNPMMAACWLAVLKAGLVAVPTMPLLRAKELHQIIAKARVATALCDASLADEISQCLDPSSEHYASGLMRVLLFNGPPSARTTYEPTLETLCAKQPTVFANIDTSRDDVCMLAFTSGTTGEPKATMHFHRDVLAMCDTFARHVLQAQAADLFIGTPPLAFTFGLGGMLCFPLAAGAATFLVERATPESLLSLIGALGATIVFTAPTFYRQMALLLQAGRHRDAIATLRKSVSAGEALPDATRQSWKAATGIEMIDGIGGTEVMHIYIAAAGAEVRRGAVGKVVPGYEAIIVDDAMRPLPAGQVGRLALKGPTGCRYLADERQKEYVKDGWNLPGDAFVKDDDGYFFYQARTDDMIVSAGYNIAGPEVESALLAHDAVAECGVVGVPDEERGHLVKAFVVLKDGHVPSHALVVELQTFVKSTVAPYKYPRQIEFVDVLPRTETGKLQRFRLRKKDQGAA